MGKRRPAGVSELCAARAHHAQAAPRRAPALHARDAGAGVADGEGGAEVAVARGGGRGQVADRGRHGVDDKGGRHGRRRVANAVRADDGEHVGAVRERRPVLRRGAGRQAAARAARAACARGGCMCQGLDRQTALPSGCDAWPALLPSLAPTERRSESSSTRHRRCIRALNPCRGPACLGLSATPRNQYPALG